MLPPSVGCHDEYLCPSSSSTKSSTMACEPARCQDVIGNLSAAVHRPLDPILPRVGRVHFCNQVLQGTEGGRSPRIYVVGTAVRQHPGAHLSPMSSTSPLCRMDTSVFRKLPLAGPTRPGISEGVPIPLRIRARL